MPLHCSEYTHQQVTEKLLILFSLKKVPLYKQ